MDSERIHSIDRKPVGRRERERQREREREREESFIDKHKVTKGLGKHCKHNALLDDTASGRTGSSIDGEYSTPTLRLAMAGRLKRLIVVVVS